MNSNFSPAETYWNYIESLCPELLKNDQIQQILDSTSWDDPQSPLDFNNCAVIALIEAERAEDLDTRELYFNLAIEALGEGSHHPLCAAHFSLAYGLIGENSTAMETAFSTLLGSLQPTFTSQEIYPPGLVYLPSVRAFVVNQAAFLLTKLFQAHTNSAQQTLMLLGEALWQSQPIFYNDRGVRLLRLLSQLLPDSAPIHLQLGITLFSTGLGEGLFHLHRAAQLAPDFAAPIHALFLAYRAFDQTEPTLFWQELGQKFYDEFPDRLEWRWAYLPLDFPITFVPFQQEVMLAVEASFRSIVTLVMVGSGDWFEAEMEFWRDVLQPGMTVIDVGANVGVYTFSAAQKVGSQGRVLAVEPFSGCVRCLEETCRINQIDWVTVCAGAASDRNGTARLSLHAASELNEVRVDDIADGEGGSYETVECFTLDSLVEKTGLERVDVLKIDAEGHELAVLRGSQHILAKDAPIILYENIAGTQGENLPVADFLNSIGYQLFYYQPYLKRLLSIASLKGGSPLNIIAIPGSRTFDFRIPE